MLKLYLMKIYDNYIQCIKNCYICYKQDDNYKDEYLDEEEKESLINHPFTDNDKVIFY